jgi:histone H3
MSDVPTKLRKLRRPHHFHPGQVAQREVERYQKSTKTLFNRHRFSVLCHELLQDMQAPKDTDFIRGFQYSAIDALQQSAEDYICSIFRIGVEKIRTEDRRETLLDKDIAPAIASERAARLGRQLEFKRIRREAEHEYRETIYAMPKLPKWEWDDPDEPSISES